MRRIILLCALLCGLLLPETAFAARVLPGATAIVVAPAFAGENTNLSDGLSRIRLADLLADYLTLDMEHHSRLSIYDTPVSPISEEQRVQQGGFTQDDAIAMGKRAGVDYVVYGDLIGLGIDFPENSTLLTHSYKTKLTLHLSLRLIDLRSGSIVGMTTCSGEQAQELEGGTSALQLLGVVLAMRGTGGNDQLMNQELYRHSEPAIDALVAGALSKTSSLATSQLITQLGVAKKQ